MVMPLDPLAGARVFTPPVAALCSDLLAWCPVLTCLKSGFPRKHSSTGHLIFIEVVEI